MLQQKIVIEIKMDSDKCRSKALKTAVEERGGLYRANRLLRSRNYLSIYIRVFCI